MRRRSRHAHHRQLAALHQRVAERSGRPLDRIEADFGRGVVLDAPRAVEYGIAEEIVA